MTPHELDEGWQSLPGPAKLWKRFFFLKPEAELCGSRVRYKIPLGMGNLCRLHSSPLIPSLRCAAPILPFIVDTCPDPRVGLLQDCWSRSAKPEGKQQDSG